MSKKTQKQKEEDAAMVAKGEWTPRGSNVVSLDNDKESKMKTTHTTGRCYESHPPLKIGEHVIYGGSCISPIVKDADIYIGFDMGMQRDHRRYPWNEGESFLFPITDMSVPTDINEFNNLIEWVAVQLIAQKKIHMGCIGGHGRTGLVFAALVKYMTGEDDAISYVRKNYCEKAVESHEQVAWLHKHFGIKEVQGAKEWHGNDGGWRGNYNTKGTTSGRSTSHASSFNDRYATKPTPPPVTRPTEVTRSAGVTTYPAKHAMSVWGTSHRLIKTN